MTEGRSLAEGRGQGGFGPRDGVGGGEDLVDADDGHDEFAVRKDPVGVGCGTCGQLGDGVPVEAVVGGAVDARLVGDRADDRSVGAVGRPGKVAFEADGSRFPAKAVHGGHDTAGGGSLRLVSGDENARREADWLAHPVVCAVGREVGPVDSVPGGDDRPVVELNHQRAVARCHAVDAVREAGDGDTLPGFSVERAVDRSGARGVEHAVERDSEALRDEGAALQGRELVGGLGSHDLEADRIDLAKALRVGGAHRDGVAVEAGGGDLEAEGAACAGGHELGVQVTFVGGGSVLGVGNGALDGDPRADEVGADVLWGNDPHQRCAFSGMW